MSPSEKLMSQDYFGQFDDPSRDYNAPYSLAIHHETLNFQGGDIRHGFQPTAFH